MGFFSELKEAMQAGEEFVTKTVSGPTTEVGRQKVQMVEAMKATGYVLVNEVERHGYIEKFFGDVPGTTYTLTFRKDAELLKAIQQKKEQEEEQRRLREKEEQKRREADEKKKQEQREKKDAAMNQIQQELLDALGKGYCVIADGAKKNRKPTVKAIARIRKKTGYTFSWKKQKKALLKIMKKFGGYCMLADFGQNTCNNLAKVFTRLGANVQVVAYDETKYAEQHRLFARISYSPDTITYTLHDVIHSLAFQKYSGMESGYYSAYLYEELIKP